MRATKGARIITDNAFSDASLAVADIVDPRNGADVRDQKANLIWAK
jgi:hypothetical protein